MSSPLLIPNNVCFIPRLGYGGDETCSVADSSWTLLITPTHGPQLFHLGILLELAAQDVASFARAAMCLSVVLPAAHPLHRMLRGFELDTE